MDALVMASDEVWRCAGSFVSWMKTMMAHCPGRNFRQFWTIQTLYAVEGGALQYAKPEPAAGNDEGDTFIGTMYSEPEEWLHYYASAAESHRAFLEMGEVWRIIGALAKRSMLFPCPRSSRQECNSKQSARNGGVRRTTVRK